MVKKVNLIFVIYIFYIYKGENYCILNNYKNKYIYKQNKNITLKRNPLKLNLLN